MITFDDGFAGVYEYAWPVLKELKVPATVFVSTAYLDSTDPFPFDRWARQHQAHLPASSYRPLTHAQCREMVAEDLIVMRNAPIHKDA